MTITLTDEMHRLLPTRVRRTAGFKAGDKIEVKAIGGIVTLIGESAIRGQDAESTPGQRQAIIADAVEARKGPYYGPFKSAGEFAAYFEAYKQRRSATKPTKAR